MDSKVRVSIFILVFLTSFSLLSVHANAWLSGWSYRKSHTIVGSIAGAQTNYQVNITVYNITGTSSGAYVYIGNKAKSNFGDIRFTSSSDSLLDYWIEEVGSNYAKFWVEIPNIPANPSSVTIYIYYGNSGATTRSNISKTFPLGDDFDDGSINTSIWTTTAESPTESGGVVTIQSASSKEGIRSGLTFNQNYSLEMRLAKQSTAAYGVRAGFSNTPDFSSTFQSDDAAYLYMATATIPWRYYSWNDSVRRDPPYDDTFSDTNFHKLKIAWNTSTVKFFTDDTLRWAESTATYVPNEASYVRLEHEYYGPDGFKVDWLFVRKYVDPEPSHGSWGSESVPSSTTTTTISMSTTTIAASTTTTILPAASTTSTIAASTTVVSSTTTIAVSSTTVVSSTTTTIIPPTRIPSFSFSATLDQININWVTDFGDDVTVDVKCKLNGVQNCNPPTYTGPSGGGGCFISSPLQYNMAPDASGVRTVPNTIYCNASDHSNPNDYSEITKIFYPVAIEVSIPQNVNLVVGEKQDAVATIKNNGTLNDTYSFSFIASNPNLLKIENGVQTTQVLDSYDIQQIFFGITLLSSGQATTATSTITSSAVPAIRFSQQITVRGSDKSLPDIGLFGVLQIMIIAAFLVSSRNS